jgi:hypothetical protein
VGLARLFSLPFIKEDRIMATSNSTPTRRDFLRAAAFSPAAIPLVMRDTPREQPPRVANHYLGEEHWLSELSEEDRRLQYLAVLALAASCQALRRILRAHRECAGCELCDDAAGMVYTVSQYRSLLESSMPAIVENDLRILFRCSLPSDMDIEETNLPDEAIGAIALWAGTRS